MLNIIYNIHHQSVTSLAYKILLSSKYRVDFYWTLLQTEQNATDLRLVSIFDDFFYHNAHEELDYLE